MFEKKLPRSVEKNKKNGVHPKRQDSQFKSLALPNTGQVEKNLMNVINVYLDTKKDAPLLFNRSPIKKANNFDKFKSILKIKDNKQVIKRFESLRETSKSVNFNGKNKVNLPNIKNFKTINTENDSINEENFLTERSQFKSKLNRPNSRLSRLSESDMKLKSTRNVSSKNSIVSDQENPFMNLDLPKLKQIKNFIKQASLKNGNNNKNIMNIVNNVNPKTNDQNIEINFNQYEIKILSERDPNKKLSTKMMNKDLNKINEYFELESENSRDSDKNSIDNEENLNENDFHERKKTPNSKKFVINKASSKTIVVKINEDRDNVELSVKSDMNSAKNDNFSISIKNNSNHNSRNSDLPNPPNNNLEKMKTQISNSTQSKFNRNSLTLNNLLSEEKAADSLEFLKTNPSNFMTSEHNLNIIEKKRHRRNTRRE